MTVAPAATSRHHLERLRRYDEEHRAAVEAKNMTSAELIAGHRAQLAALIGDLDALIEMATHAGWAHTFRCPWKSNPKEDVVFTRDDEQLTVSFGNWIEAVTGEVATGPVSWRSINRRDGFITADAVAELLTGRRRSDYPDTEIVLVVGEHYIHRREAETACNYSEYRLQPGVYPVELVDSNYRQLGGQRRAYWAITRVPAVQFHTYYVSRLLHHSELDESWDESPAVICETVYSFQLPRLTVTELPADLTGKAVYIRRADLPADYTIGPSAA